MRRVLKYQFFNLIDVSSSGLPVSISKLNAIKSAVNLKNTIYNKRFGNIFIDITGNNTNDPIQNVVYTDIKKALKFLNLHSVQQCV